MTMTTEDELRQSIITEVRYLARTRQHRLSARQLAALETQTTASIRAMRAYLENRPAESEKRAWEAREVDIAAMQPGAIAARVHQATVAAVSAAAISAAAISAAAISAAEGITPHAKAGGAPASDEPRARRVPPAERPQGDGYFLHEDRIYKVITSQYGSSQGHLYAKRLDEGDGEWNRVQGMVSYLRETERINLARATEIGRRLSNVPGSALYGKCWICGRVLTDETSIANGVGPGPHAGVDD